MTSVPPSESGTPRPLSVLIVEDREDDVLLSVHELERGGWAPTFERVDNAPALTAAMRRGAWDLVLSDWAMPRFGAIQPLSMVREHDPDAPFIILSGTIGEETAVAALRAGAHDFLLKGKLTRLLPAVERELRESKARHARREAEQALRRSELRFRRLAESGVLGIFTAQSTGRVVEANDAFLNMVGYTRDDLVQGSIDWAAMTPAEWRHLDAVAADRLQNHGVAVPWEKEYLRKDATRVPVLVGLASLEGDQRIAVALDLSERKRLEEQLRCVLPAEADYAGRSRSQGPGGARRVCHVTEGACALPPARRSASACASNDGDARAT
jgi:PAS domain S-box-containing protein